LEPVGVNKSYWAYHVKVLKVFGWYNIFQCEWGYCFIMLENRDEFKRAREILIGPKANKDLCKRDRLWIF
jgi:hypothetical protein